MLRRNIAGTFQIGFLVKFEDKWKELGQTQGPIRAEFGFSEEKRNREEELEGGRKGSIVCEFRERERPNKKMNMKRVRGERSEVLMLQG